jgi:hypothetical protein
MQFKFDLEKKTLKELEDMIVAIPKRARAVLREAGQLYIEELNNAVGRLTRAKRHGFVKRNDPRTLRGSFSLRSVSQNTLQVTTPIPWASIIDEGGVITHPRMTIPFSGVTISNDELAALRSSGQTFAKKGVIFLKSGRSGKTITPIFRLKGRVPITATYYSTKAELKATPKIMKLFSDAVDGKNSGYF